jgi:type IV fimbrial biogenesis protein FimT
MGHRQLLDSQEGGFVLSVAARDRRQRGFTTVELLVALVIIAILASIATPTIRSVFVNTRIRSASQSMQNGLAMARTEAIRLNTQVEFVMRPTGWVVRRVSDGTVLQQASGKEAPTGLTLTTTPAATDRVTFNSFGQSPTVNPSNGSERIDEVDIEAVTPPTSGSYRPLRIEITTSGLARLCDPAVADTEPRACLL